MGDVHGRLDLLDELMARIDEDDAGRPSAATSVIFLGDLVDRGPDSAQVVQRLLDLSRKDARLRFLMGNHEEVFLKALNGSKGALPFLIRIGGKATVLSYGISEDEYSRSTFPELLQLLRARVPPEHIAFLRGFEDVIEIGDYAFVHAGVAPGVPLAGQVPANLRWIRDEFTTYGGPLERIIVHGHTVTEEVQLRPWRIGIDTGAYASGTLTAIGLEDDRRWLLQT